MKTLKKYKKYVVKKKYKKTCTTVITIIPLSDIVVSDDFFKNYEEK